MNTLGICPGIVGVSMFLPKTNIHMALPCLGQESYPHAALGKLKPTAAGIRKNEPGLEQQAFLL